MTCCTKLTQESPCRTSFMRMICLGWYDGPTEGFVLCASCGEASYFDLLAWDSLHGRRVFELQMLPHGAFSRVQELLTAVGEPSWPCWTPRWQLDNTQELRRVETELDALRGQRRGPPILLVTPDRLESSDRAVAVSEEVAQRMSGMPRGEEADFDEWFDLVQNISRG